LNEALNNIQRREVQPDERIGFNAPLQFIPKSKMAVHNCALCEQPAEKSLTIGFSDY
jgi:hypothetical protein